MQQMYKKEPMLGTEHASRNEEIDWVGDRNIAITINNKCIKGQLQSRLQRNCVSMSPNSNTPPRWTNQNEKKEYIFLYLPSFHDVPILSPPSPSPSQPAFPNAICVYMDLPSMTLEAFSPNLLACASIWGAYWSRSLRRKEL